MRRVVEVRALLDGRGEGGFSNGKEYIKRICAGRFCVCCQRRSRQIGAEVAENVEIVAENHWKFYIKSTNKMFDGVETNREVDGGFGVVGGANCRQRSRRQIVAENPENVANRHEIGDFDVNPFVFDPRRRSSGRYVEVRTAGVIGGVRQIVAEKISFVVGNRQEVGNNHANVFIVGPKQCRVGVFVETRMRGAVGVAGEQDCCREES